MPSFEQAQTLELQRHIGHLTGSFQKKRIKKRSYWYFAYRDIDGGMRRLGDSNAISARPIKDLMPTALG